MNTIGKIKKALLQPARLVMVDCAVCETKGSIQTEYDGWIQCPFCHGSKKITLAMKIAASKIVSDHRAGLGGGSLV